MRKVLLTGATGSIGSAVLTGLLAEPGTHISLLIRAASPLHLEQRLLALCSYLGQGPAAVAGRLTPYAGDICQPQLGLTAGDYAHLSTDVTHVIHAAGNVKLNQSLDDARRNAVTSAIHVMDFALACLRANAAPKIEFISTVGIAGRTRGLVPERRFPEPRGFRNTYEAAKAEAEDLIFAHMDHLPITIHRPSMVVGDSQTGQVIHYQIFYHLAEFLVGLRTHGIVPHFGPCRLDIIPSDYVAQAILISSRRDDSAGRIFHLCSGPLQSIPLETLALTLRTLFLGYGERLPRLRRVSAGTLRFLLPLIGMTVTERDRKALRLIPFFLDYLDEEQVFDNALSAAYFAALGLTLPTVDSYLGRILSPYLMQRGRPGKQPG